MAKPQNIKIKVESETSEFNMSIKDTDKAKGLLEIIKAEWGDDLSYKLEYYSVEMKIDEVLSAYNLKDGSVVKVTWLVDLVGKFANIKRDVRGLILYKLI